MEIRGYLLMTCIAVLQSSSSASGKFLINPGSSVNLGFDSVLNHGNIVDLNQFILLIAPSILNGYLFSVKPPLLVFSNEVLRCIINTFINFSNQ